MTISSTALQVISLTEKLQAKDQQAGAPVQAQNKSEPIPGDMADIVGSLHFNVKVEDRLSTGSGGSAVVDEESPVQLVDSGDSYFQSNQYPGGGGGCVGPAVDGIHSEEDDGSDDSGRSYFSDVFAAAEQKQHEEGECLDWWPVWS